MEVEYNPWNVLSIEAFHFYNCPECDDKYSTRELFVEHALVVHEKAQATLPTILKNNLAISNVHSIQDDETEDNCDDEEFKLESSVCIVKAEPITESDIERDINCDASFNMLKKEETLADLQLKNCERTIKCEFQDESNKNHVMDPLSKRHRCNQCVKDFSNKRNLKKHIQSVHNDAGLTFQCDHCSKTYNYSKGLREHIKNVHEGATFKCLQCLKTYNSRTGLRDHIKSIHEGVTYHCEHCGKDFTHVNHLKRHIESVHEGLTYQCEQCHKVYRQSSLLKKHIRLKHIHTQ